MTRYPDNKEYAKSFKDGGQWCGDVYRTIVRLYSVGFEYHTFPDDHGVTIVTGVSDIKSPRYLETPTSGSIKTDPKFYTYEMVYINLHVNCPFAASYLSLAF